MWLALYRTPNLPKLVNHHTHFVTGQETHMKLIAINPAMLPGDHTSTPNKLPGSCLCPFIYLDDVLTSYGVVLAYVVLA